MPHPLSKDVDLRLGEPDGRVKVAPGPGTLHVPEEPVVDLCDLQIPPRVGKVGLDRFGSGCIICRKAANCAAKHGDSKAVLMNRTHGSTSNRRPDERAGGKDGTSRAEYLLQPI